MQSKLYLIITLVILSTVTLLLRVLPFVLFPAGRPIPAAVRYLGKVLPPALIGMLVVYCLKGTTVTAYPYGLPEAIAVAAVCLLHLWKRNSLLSIGGGTILYMLLVQLVF